MEQLAGGVEKLKLERGPAQDYGLPKDHPYTPPEERIPIPLKLRTAEEYIAMDGEIVNAAEDAFRTHASDPDPVAATFSQMLSEEECAEIIRLAAPKMTRAGVTTDDGKGGRQSAGRTNDSCWLPHDTSPQLWDVVQRISEIIGLPSECAEDVQVIHYSIGQEYRKHWDAYNPLNERGIRATATGGNRVVTALMYLSDVEEGGGTGFINMRTDVSAERGKVLVFHNCYLGTRSLHPDSNHAGLPVIAGDKWACNLWYREAPMPGGAGAKERQQKLATPA